MAFCSNCGKEIGDGHKFCTYCGVAVEGTPQAEPQPQTEPQTQATSIFDTNEVEMDAQDIADNKAVSIFAYIGLLFLIPLLAAPKSKFARFHTNQGLVLFLAEVIVGTAVSIVAEILDLIPVVGVIGSLMSTAVSIAALALMVVGIINAANGKAKELPVIGSIKLLK